MAGYTRQSAGQIVNGVPIDPGPLNNEFNALRDAFDPATGHTHDGSTGSGQKINISNSTVGNLPPERGGTGQSSIADTKTAYALNNVDNTTDANKPISNAQAIVNTNQSTTNTNLQNGITARVIKAGDRMVGSLSSAVKDHGSLGATTETYSYTDGNTHKVTISGAHTINPTGQSEGDVMQINVLFQSGSITVSGTTYWELGNGRKTTTIADLNITLVAGTAYRIIFEIVAGIRLGVIT